jgi:hypothetical protein
MRSAAPRTPAAEIVSNPTDSAVFGLKNLSGLIWSVTVPGGSPRSLEPGKSVRLAAGTKINFGPVQAEITPPTRHAPRPPHVRCAVGWFSSVQLSP